MYFSRIKKVGGIGKTDHPDSIHKCIWQFFRGVPAGQRPFIYRFDLEHGTPTFYVVSTNWWLETACKVDDFAFRASPDVPKKAPGRLSGQGFLSRIGRLRFTVAGETDRNNHYDKRCVRSCRWNIIRRMRRGIIHRFH